MYRKTRKIHESLTLNPYSLNEKHSHLYSISILIIYYVIVYTLYIKNCKYVSIIPITKKQIFVLRKDVPVHFLK